MIEDLHGHWNVQLTCGSGWTKAAEQHQMFSAEHSDISLCALEMTAVKTDNQLNMQKQTCIQPHLATHNHTHTHTSTHIQDYIHKSTKLWFFLIRLWWQRYPDVTCMLLSPSCFSRLSFIWFFFLWADCLFDKCACYRPSPSSCFSFPLTFIAFIFFFSNFCSAPL